MKLGAKVIAVDARATGLERDAENRRLCFLRSAVRICTSSAQVKNSCPARWHHASDFYPSDSGERGRAITFAYLLSTQVRFTASKVLYAGTSISVAANFTHGIPISVWTHRFCVCRPVLRSVALLWTDAPASGGAHFGTLRRRTADSGTTWHVVDRRASTQSANAGKHQRNGG